MIKLDSQHRLTIPKDLRKIARINTSDDLYLIYCDKDNYLLKFSPNWEIDKAMGIVHIDGKGRIFLKSLLDYTPGTELLLLANPDGIYIKREGED